MLTSPHAPRLPDEWQVAPELWNHGCRAVDAAATNLKRFAEQIDSQRSGSPAFLAVICGKGYGYRRALPVLSFVCRFVASEGVERLRSS